MEQAQFTPLDFCLILKDEMVRRSAEFYDFLETATYCARLF